MKDAGISHDHGRAPSPVHTLDFPKKSWGRGATAGKRPLEITAIMHLVLADSGDSIKLMAGGFSCQAEKPITAELSGPPGLPSTR
jgi:hypothetical protein